MHGEVVYYHEGTAPPFRAENAARVAMQCSTTMSFLRWADCSWVPSARSQMQMMH